VDKELLALALAEDRILLTEDKDFGWLVHAARGLTWCGVDPVPCFGARIACRFDFEAGP
jgi:hypothetical protein